MGDTIEIDSDSRILVNRRAGPVAGLNLTLPIVSPGAFLVLNGIVLGGGQILAIDNAGFFVGLKFEPTVVYSASFFSGGRTFQDSATYKNSPGVATSQLHHTGFYANPTIVGDGALFTTDRTGFFDSPIYSIVNGGTISGKTSASHESSMAIGTGVTITERGGYVYHDATGAGSLTLQKAIDIDALSKGATNIGIRNASTQVETPSVATLSAAGSTIAPNAAVKRLDNTSGGALTLTATPIIADGQDGQRLLLFNSSAQNVILTHGSANNLRLDGGTNKTLAQRASIQLMFSTDLGDWIQVQPVVSPT